MREITKRSAPTNRLEGLIVRRHRFRSDRNRHCDFHASTNLPNIFTKHQISLPDESKCCADLMSSSFTNLHAHSFQLHFVNVAEHSSPLRIEAAGFPFAIGGELRAILLRRGFVKTSRKLCCTAIMKGQTSKNWRAMLVSVLWTRLTLENWRAKLISLVLATTVWYLIKKNMTTTASPSERPSTTPVTETR